MQVDRLETLSVINFLKDAIPSEDKTGKNCVFIRVEGPNLICTGGGEYVIKKATLEAPNTIDSAAGVGKKLPNQFMIPRAALFAFKKIMEEHKSDCKKMQKDDPSYMFVEITDNELISLDERIHYEQPKYEFKDMDKYFNINKAPVTNIPVIGADITVAISGFKKSDEIEMKFTGPKDPILFEQGGYQAILFPVREKEKGDEQMTTDGETNE